MKQYCRVEEMRPCEGMIHLVVDGEVVEKELKGVSPRLASANDEDLKHFEVSPSGYGIHWATLDEGISIDGSLGIVDEPGSSRKSAQQVAPADVVSCVAELGR